MTTELVYSQSRRYQSWGKIVPRRGDQSLGDCYGPAVVSALHRQAIAQYGREGLNFWGAAAMPPQERPCLECRDGAMRLYFLILLFVLNHLVTMLERHRERLCVGIGVSIIAGDPGQMLNSTWQVALPLHCPAVVTMTYPGSNPDGQPSRCGRWRMPRFCNPSLLRLIACHHTSPISIDCSQLNRERLASLAPVIGYIPSGQWHGG